MHRDSDNHRRRTLLLNSALSVESIRRSTSRPSGNRRVYRVETLEERRMLSGVGVGSGTTLTVTARSSRCPGLGRDRPTGPQPSHPQSVSALRTRPTPSRLPCIPLQSGARASSGIDQYEVVPPEPLKEPGRGTAHVAQEPFVV